MPWLLKYVLRNKKLQSSNQVKAEHYTVNNQSDFFLAFITKSSWNLVKFVCLSLSLLHQMLSVDNFSWNIATLLSWILKKTLLLANIKLRNKGPRGWINEEPLIQGTNRPKRVFVIFLLFLFFFVSLSVSLEKSSVVSSWQSDFCLLFKLIKVLIS